MSSPPTSPSPVPTTAEPGVRPQLSAGLAIGLVLCPVIFILLLVALRRVARKGDIFTRLPTARLRNAERSRRRDLVKFMAWGSVSHPPGSTSPRGDRTSGSASPTLPLYELPAPPPPVYTPPSSALPAYDLAIRAAEV